MLTLPLALSLLNPAPAGAQRPSAPYVPGEVLVTYHPGLRASAVSPAVSALLAEAVTVSPRSRVQRLRLRGTSTEAAIRALRSDPTVAHAQPNYIYRASATPNDPGFAAGDLWGLHNMGQNSGTVDADIDAPEAWDLATGSSDVVVAVIDTGIDYNHPDLQANVWTNAGEISGNGLDDDGNGYVDDVHGWNAVANNGDPMDDNQHGTHVAGTIGATGNNGAGVVGAAWNVKIIAAKFLDASGGGTSAGAIACLDYVHALKDRGVNVVATNNSWGAGGSKDTLLQAKIAESETRGILFVAAAGNGDAFGRAINNDSSPQYPASFDNANIIAVTATDRNDKKASWANYGATSVDLGAPGVSIVSTTPNSSYASFSGTSMATPQVTGAVALLRAYDAALTPADIKKRLLDTGDPNADLEGKTLTGRRLNLYYALTNTVVPKPVKRTMTVAVTTRDAYGNIKTSFKFGQYVYIRIQARDAETGAAVAGAPLSLVVRTPNGYQQSASGTTDSYGNATFSYYPYRSYGSGTYRTTATVSATNYNSSSGSTTFTVYK